MRRLPPTIVAGGGVLAALVVAASIGPALLGGDPLAIEVGARLAPPAPSHVLGRDALGRDVLARMLLGGRLSLLIAAATVGLSVTIGLVVGTIAALGGRWVDEALSRIIDILLAFPGLLLTIALAAVLGPSVGNVVLALAVLGWTGWARLVRSEVRGASTHLFVEAARALGARPLWVVVRHVIPHAAPTLLVQSTFALSSAITAEASLSFLGLGVPAPLPSWGAMLDEGREFLLVAPHLVVFPGLALATTVLGLQLLGDGLRDHLDVRDGPQR